jgi:hypothetical protein
MSVEIDDAVSAVLTLIRERPEKNMLAMCEDFAAGRRPTGCPINLGRVQHWTEVSGAPQDVAPGFKPPEESLLAGLRGIPQALEMENPFTPALGTGYGVPTVATAFGSEIDWSPRNAGGVAGYLPLGSFDDFETPDIHMAGVFPRIRADIEYYRAHTPPEIKINFPDLLGPINIAHLLLGTELFFAMRDEPARLHHLLQMIAEFLIQCFTVLPQWIGEERMFNFAGNSQRIAECSVNLISREAYREFGLPYDRQISEALGAIGIHTCTGLHVFEETLEGLPNVVYTEWGDCRNSFAPQVSLDRAVELIGEQPIVLSGGRELWEGDFSAEIKDDLARLEDHDLLTFGYSGMRWKDGDEAHITGLHRQIDEYYEKKYA